MSSRRFARFQDALLHHALRFFRLKDSRERGARGFAIGMACNFFPTFGLGAVISGFLARLFGGNIVAGFIGGSTLAFFWPLLFLMNIRMGGRFLRSPIVIDDLDDVTPQTVNALVWGQTFAIGAIINSILFGLLAYLVFLLLYQRISPFALKVLRQKLRARRRVNKLADFSSDENTPKSSGTLGPPNA